MKPTRIIFIILILIMTMTLPVFAGIEINSEAGILINANTGQILYQKNIHEPMYPASTTKILTAIIILEDMDLQEIVEIDPQSPYAGGSHIALEPGERVTVEQLLYALMIASGNDAAESLARAHSGTIDAFVDVMNERAVEMGALNSNFANPHGLHHKDHISTAYDLAVIAKYAMKNPDFRRIVNTRRYEIPPTNIKTETRYLNSTNSLYHGISGSDSMIVLDGKQVPTAYEFADGIKRGYTPEAQFCFVGSATTEDERQFISVVLKTQNAYMYQDTRILFNYGQNHTQRISLANIGEVAETITLNNKKETTINAVFNMPSTLDLPIDRKVEEIEKKIIWKDTLELPILKDEIIGQIEYYLDDSLLLQLPLVSDDDYMGENLINDITYYFDQETTHFSIYLIKGLIAVLLWRTIMTIIRLRKRQKKLEKNQ